MNNSPRLSWTEAPLSLPQRIARSSAMIVATAPSVFSVDFSYVRLLSGRRQWYLVRFTGLPRNKWLLPNGAFGEKSKRKRKYSPKGIEFCAVARYNKISKKSLMAFHETGDDAAFFAEVFLYALSRPNKKHSNTAEYQDAPLLAEANYECPL